MITTADDLVKDSLLNEGASIVQLGNEDNPHILAVLTDVNKLESVLNGLKLRNPNAIYSVKFENSNAIDKAKGFFEENKWWIIGGLVAVAVLGTIITNV